MAKKERRIVRNGVVIRKGPKTRSVLPYDIAKETIQRLAPHVKSAKKYYEWRKITGSKFMPGNPASVYDNFSWIDFLGSKNTTVGERIYLSRTKKVRPMWDAIKWVQKYCQNHGINTAESWKAAHRKDASMPKDIPMHPEREYSDFPGYPVWLGKTPMAQLEAVQRQIPVLALVHPRGEPDNVLETLKLPSESDFRDMWSKQRGYDLLGCWKWEKELESDYSRLMDRFGGDERIIVPNVHELTWELNSLFEMVRI